jgi:hypothetical protein
MRNFLDKSCGKNQNKYFIFNNFSENRVIYKTMSKNMLGLEEPQVTSQYGAYALLAG